MVQFMNVDGGNSTLIINECAYNLINSFCFLECYQANQLETKGSTRSHHYDMFLSLGVYLEVFLQGIWFNVTL